MTNRYERLFNLITGDDFKTYYNKEKPNLQWYISDNYTKDMDSAGDIANRAFMQALEKIETYDKEKSLFKTWLTKIAINLVIKDWKDRHRYTFISLERDASDSPSILNILKSDDSDDTVQEKENKKKAEIVYDVIDKLPDKYKKVMVMRELNKMAYKDIADSIKKEIKIELDNDSTSLENPEDFYSLDLQNNGSKPLIINFKSESGDMYQKTVSPNTGVSITRDDINWNRSMNDTFVIDSTYTYSAGTYITTTNLSTIKSQIKKGRELIYNKVRKKFDYINENGIDNFYF